MRRHPRFPVGLVGTLELLDQGGHGLAYGIRISDVSQGGLGLTLGGAVEVGARVRVLVDGGVLIGVVAHCRQGVGHFCAGIAIEHDSGSLSRLGWLAILHPPRPSNVHT